ncbi:hypothetical protein QRX50_29760 [Amycolatopsis carbonis]|uniref:Uncharacterized protein n=1 Tax=Amycolatopsis carbonis TaxID=715471 RepID=A0A9Y2IC59_9PSEU|nr:hypothetical protein [Amycolatopsis sp. 2-15]WIX75673.1 hypothetical protein QRX50_29760 [Amycolatopsis sp. 2-15]
MHLPQVAIAMLVNDRDEVLYRPIIGLQIGINRILEHLGAAPVTDATSPPSVTAHPPTAP